MPSNQFLAVMDAAVDAVVLIDHQGLIQAFNRAAERLFGWSAAEVQGRNVSVLMPEPDRSAHDQHLARYHSTGIPHIIGVGRELEAQRRDGHRFPIHLSVGRVDGAEPPQFVGFVRDITVQIETRRTNERLMNVSRMATMGEMAAGIAHELNQPLTAIANYARAGDRFLASPVPDLDETREALREIAAEALRAGSIIRRLRQLVRGGEDKRELVTVTELMEDLRPLAMADAKANDTRLRFELDPHTPRLLVHRVQITQALLNLLRNALESLHGEAAGTREIEIRCRKTQTGDCEIAISDNGPGVAAEILDRMFDPFRTTKPEGTGLGLPMSQTIAQAHGGTVQYQPAAPRGACFTLTLPPAESPHED
ncbi:MAG TPA: PAS domain S-box protein [Steroidobacteraceae bacterium]|nr:PAS domain S-box protein [Steroidobacteraceae bacterium]